MIENWIKSGRIIHQPRDVLEPNWPILFPESGSSAEWCRPERFPHKSQSHLLKFSDLIQIPLEVQQLFKSFRNLFDWFYSFGSFAIPLNPNNLTKMCDENICQFKKSRWPSKFVKSWQKIFETTEKEETGIFYTSFNKKWFKSCGSFVILFRWRQLEGWIGSLYQWCF